MQKRTKEKGESTEIKGKHEKKIKQERAKTKKNEER